MVSSLLILIPFGLAQTHRLSPTSGIYIVSNLLGSTILAVQALRVSQWGFLLLEGSWALISLAGLVVMVNTKRSTRSYTALAR
ncbi:CBU_0592 family membrane protein [Rhodococcus opacus]|uniref:CBU_0592 family membrane protein n=1 Tax=Rhodococcus opacus TaxID=37919 RepID=UPI0039C29CD3